MLLWAAKRVFSRFTSPRSPVERSHVLRPGQSLFIRKRFRPSPSKLFRAWYVFNPLHFQYKFPLGYRHTLDVLSNLAKSFPTHFLPTKGKPSLYCHESSSKIYNIVERKGPISPPADSKSASTTKVTPTAVACTSKKSDVPEFWDILLKLDCATSSKKVSFVDLQLVRDGYSRNCSIEN